MRRLTLARLVVFIFCCGPSQAIAATWSNMEGGDWHRADNWDGNIPAGLDAAAVFQPQFPLWDASILLNESVTLASLGTTNPAQISITGSGELLLADATQPSLHVGGGNGGELVIEIPTTLLGDSHVVMVQDVVSTLRFSAPIAGTDIDLVKEGLGTLVFANDNPDLSGTLTINSGRARFERPSALDVDVKAGQLQVESNVGTLHNSISLSGGALTTTGGAILTTAIQLPTTSESRLLAAPGATLHLKGGAMGVGSLSFVGGGTFDIEKLGHKGGISLQDGAVNLLDHSGHSGGTNILAGSFVVTTDGSLVGTGSISVQESGELVIAKPAGPAPTPNSVSSQSVQLLGGTLRLRGNIDPTSSLSSASTGGVIALSDVAGFDAGGSLVLDFGTMPAGSNMRLGSVGTSSLASELALFPAVDGAVKFGGGTGTLVVSNVITDRDAQVVSVEQSVSGITRLFGDNTYTGLTTVIGGELTVEHAAALGSPAAGTTVAGGSLTINVATPEPITAMAGGEVTINRTTSTSGALYIEGGKISLNARSNRYDSQVTMAGGEFFVNTDANLFVLPEGLVLTDGNGSRLKFNFRSQRTVNANTFGQGDLVVDVPFGGATLTVNNSNWSHTGAVTYIGSGNTDFNIDTSHDYTGPTTIESARVHINDSGGLGDLTGETIIKSGELWLNVPTEEPLHVTGVGEVIMTSANAQRSTAIRMSGGTLRTPSDSTFSAPLQLEPGESTINASSLLLSGGSSGAGDLRVITDGVRIEGLPLTHQGKLIVDGYGVKLNSANQHQGTTILSGETTVNHFHGLGVSDHPVHVKGGTLFLNVATTNDIVVENAGVQLASEASSYDGTISLRNPSLSSSPPGVSVMGEFNGDIVLESVTSNLVGGGTFQGEIRGHGPVSFSGNIQLNASNSFTGLASIRSGSLDINHPDALGSTDQGTIVRRGTLNVNVPTVEPLMLASHGTINLHEQLAHLPFSVPGSQGTVAIHVPSQYEDAPTLFDTTLEVKADTTLGGLTVRGESGGVVVSPGSTLQVSNGTLDLLAGEIQGRLVVDGAIRKFGSGKATLERLVGYTGEIEVHRGVFALTGAESGDDPSYSVGLNSTRYASVHLDARDVDNGTDFPDPIRYGQDISLNGAQGSLYRPALQVTGIFGSQTATLSGILDLGEGDVTIGGNASRLELEGDVIGGSLSLLDGLGVRLTGGPKSYVGETQIRDGVMLVDGVATVENSSRIVLHEQGHMHLSYGEDTQELNRISDDIPIVTNGGSLTVYSAENVRATEQLGPLTLNQGHFEIEADTSDLVMSSLSRTPYATVFFDTDSSNGAPGTIRFLEDVPLEHGIIGAWAITRDENTASFATIGPNGVVPLTEFVTEIGNATPDANLQLQDSEVLTSDLHVHTLTFASSSSVLDLNGFTLNVASGGISGGRIINGQLTAGLVGDAELFLGSRVEADIVDNDNGTVSVVMGGAYFDGNNSYSGKTVVNGGRLTLGSETALPQGTELILNGGDLWIEAAPDEPHRLKKFVLGGGAETLARGGTINFDAEFIEVYDGTFESGVQLVGTGTMIKDSPGTVIIGTGNPDYAGEIIVRDGRLTGRGFGTGSIRVEAGVLASWWTAEQVSNPITLIGGALASSSAPFSGTIDVLAPAEIINEGEGEISGMIQGNQPLTFESVTDPENPFLISGDNSLYSGDVIVNSGTLRVERGSSLGSGTISVNIGGRLELGSVTTDNDIAIQGGEIFSREAPAEITGIVSVQSTAYVGADFDHLGLVISGAVELADGSRLYKVGEADLTITGEIGVTGTAEIVLPQGAVNVSGVLSPRTDETVLNIVGLGFEQLDLSLQVPDGTKLNVQQNGGATRLQVGEGQFVGGNGVVENDLEFAEGATVRPGESVGELTGAGNVTWGAAAGYEWEINDALHPKGVENGKGADLLLVGDTLEITASNESPFSIGVASIDGVGQLAALDNFDPRESYHWTLASAAKVVGFDSNRFELDVASFLATNEIAPGAEFDLELIDSELVLNYDASVSIDLNGDSSVTIDDVDLLVSEIVAGGTRFDLTRDGEVDDGDLTVWLSKAGVHLGFDGALLFGDANLDGVVGAADLNVVGLNWQKGVSAWSSGDFTADGIVNAADLNQIGQNWLADVITPVTAVPEPGVSGLGLLLALASLSRFTRSATLRC